MDLKTAKAELRQAIKDRLTRMSEKDRAAESRSVCRRIREALPPSPLTVCGYIPLNDEVDLRPLLTELLERGDEIFLPCFDGKKLVFRKAENLTDLHPGQFGIPEPPVEAVDLDPHELSVALIPARAFDRAGHRLGRGNGGYDIWIRAQKARNPATQFWGIAFECQLANDIPLEEHDEKVDEVITARGFAPQT